ncbi:MAG: TadE/TadG family type IV pilus assembly protein, partial [Acidithiobacillus sp.]
HLFGVTLRPVVGVDGQVRWGLPLQAEALMRMQSPVLPQGLPSRASLEHGQDGGSGDKGPGAGDWEPIPPPPSDLPNILDSDTPPPKHICNIGQQ